MMDKSLRSGNLADQFLSKGINTVGLAMSFVADLPFSRNSDKNDPLIVLKELKGTCSTKHSLLYRLLDEQDENTFQLMIGIFKMNSKNSPQVKEVLDKYKLQYIPEAHCYFRENGLIKDFTWPVMKGIDFEKDLMDEIVINADQINEFKINYHQEFLKRWASDKGFSFEEIWEIRENCVKQLSINN